MTTLTGRAFIKVEGEQLSTMNGAKLTFGNIESTPVVTDQGVAGFTEKPTVPQIEATIPHSKAVSLTTLAAIKDQSITFETDSGKTYILSNARTQNNLELTANENGDLPITFVGMKCEEVN